MVRLNIGLNRNDGEVAVEREALATKILHDLAAFYLEPKALGIGHSDTEPTLIVDVVRMPTATMVEYLCAAYGQDCIAAYDYRTSRGGLYGPGAAKWGEFNPEYFLIDIDGRRLGVANYPLEV